MKLNEIRKKIEGGALEAYAHIYPDLEHQKKRYLSALDAFEGLYGSDGDVRLFSVPGRSEISGNHTDHNRGVVLAGAIDRDIIAVVSERDDGVIHFRSEGYPEDVVELSRVSDPAAYSDFSSAALIAGMAQGFRDRGCEVGGFNAYSTTEVLKGSGLSSSAAFEVMVGNIMNHLYNNGALPAEEIAKLAQFSENVYFGKPCGLMDQMACAVGGFVYIDFLKPDSPMVEPIDFSLSDAGYSLCIVNTGGNHADLNEDYAAVPAEMKSVAAIFGKGVLRGLSEGELTGRAAEIRRKVGDRALLRAYHFLRECRRVDEQRHALKTKNTKAFLRGVTESGNSSFKYLQNVYTTKNPSEQGLSLALCITEGFIDGKECACRVHGGGFAGTIQAFIREELAAEYCGLMNGVFGEGATMYLNIRPVGATEITL